MKYFLTVLLCFSLLIGNAQRVDGTWEGTITLERPGPQTEHKFQLVLKRDGKKMKGTAYIFYEDQSVPTVVGMDLSGEFFSDRSMRLFNHEVLYPTQQPNKEKHIRKYQLMYTRSVWGDKIEGYWQEKNDPIFEMYRKGRVYLKRKQDVAKA